MKLFKKAKKGFTLVELVVVIAVIAILAAVSVGAYFGVTESAKNSQALQEGKALHTNLLLMANDPANDYVSFSGENLVAGLDTTTTDDDDDRYSEATIVAQIAKAAGKENEVFDTTSGKYPQIDLVAVEGKTDNYDKMIYDLDGTHKVTFVISTGAQA